MWNVYEDNKHVGYIAHRSWGYQFVASKAYFATGKAAMMDETVGDSPSEVAHKLRKAGLTVVQKEGR